MGWWRVLGASWYFYPTPVYPYPNRAAPRRFVSATCRHGTTTDSILVLLRSITQLLPFHNVLVPAQVGNFGE